MKKTTVNLPVETVVDFIDVNDQNVEVPIIDTIKHLETKSITSMWANPEILGHEIEWNVQVFTLNKIYKNICKETMKEQMFGDVIKSSVKYFDLTVKYFNDIRRTFLVPGFVKFFSKTTKTFVPIEFLKKTDLLVDHALRDVQMVQKKERTDFSMIGKDYYSFTIFADEPQKNDMKEDIHTYGNQFYLNQILAMAYFYNYENVPKE